MSRRRLLTNLIRTATPWSMALLLTLPAFASQPAAVDPDLQRISARLAQLDADPSLGQLGDVDRLKARQAIAALAQTGVHSRDRPQALYIAERRVAAAEFAAQADLAEREIEQLDHDHDRILLEASRRDADQARREAERLRLQNSAREEEMQRAAAEHQEQIQQAAGMASDESDQARTLAEARAKESALAQQEAALSSGTSVPTPPPATLSEPRGPSMTVPGAAFPPGMASLRKDAATQAQANALVAFVKAQQGTIRVEGHTDNRGNPQANLTLSQQRADAIKQLLVTGGVSASRIQSIGLGAEQPIASNATAPGRERNRRVEVIVMRGGK